MRTVDLTVKERFLEGFGLRLATLRKARGLMGEKVGLSPRMVAYYETQGGQPTRAVLPDLARTLGISTVYRLRKRLFKVEELPPDDQKTVLKIVDALLEKRRGG